MTEHHYKLLVTDIDGTLINRLGDISAANKEALALAISSGMYVSLSTGRSIKSSRRYIDQLSLDSYHIFFDGALVSNPEKDEEIYADPISQDSVREAIEFAHRHETIIELYSATDYFVEQETWATDIRRQFFGLQFTVVDFADLWQKERIIKGSITISTAEERAKAESFYRHFEDSLSFSWTKTPAYPEIDFINVIAPEVSKGKALEALASHLGIALSEVIAIGDGANDVSLLSKAGLAIAMGNASNEVKAIADHVTLDVDHSGVAAAIEKFLL